MNIVIREAILDDIARIVEINIESWQNTYASIIDNDDLFSIDKQERIEKFQTTFSEKKILVATLNGEVVGFAWYNENMSDNSYENEIVALYVDLKYRKNGVGKTLFEGVINKINKRGTSNLIIWCLEKNYNARKFYERLGGNLIKESKKFLFCNKEYNEVGYLYKI